MRKAIVPILLGALTVSVVVFLLMRWVGSGGGETDFEPPPLHRLQVRKAATPAQPAAMPPPPLWPASSRPNIVLISVDTLRRDHLGCYGYPRDTSPALDRLCGDAVVFDDAVVPIPKTTPSLTSLLSGLYPKTHHVLTLGIPIPSRVTFISQLLRERGYITVGICGQFNCHRVFGFDRGFDTYDDTFAEEIRLGESHDLLGGGFHPEAERRAADLVGAAIAWLDRPRERPFFMWVHFMDPHAGYAPPPPFDTTFSDPPPGARRAIFGPRLPLSLIHPQALVDEIDEYGFYVNRYDGEIRYLDTQLGRLLHELRQRDLYDDTLIVFTSDHGEYMGESSVTSTVFSHGHTAYESEVRAPLVIKLPGQVRAGTRHAAAISTVDIVPSLVPDAMGVEGRPLPRTAASDRTQMIQLPKKRAIFAVRHGGHKVVVRTGHSTGDLIAALRRGESVDVDAELYDLATDPWERRPISSGEALSWALDALALWLVEAPAVVIPEPECASPMSEETAGRLRSLGYLQ